MKARRRISPSNTVIACVFKESPTFPIEYVRVFQSVFGEYHPEYRLVCLTDYDGQLPSNVEKIPLAHEWSSGWWGKMELFRPDIISNENIIFTDLDNIITRPLDDVIERLDPKRPMMIKDLDPKKERLQSAFMWIPNSAKSVVWTPFIESPLEHIKSAGHFGDAAIIRKYYTRGDVCDVFQDVMPEGTICSYPYHYQKGKYRNASIVCFHGKKRKPLLMINRNESLLKDHFHRHLQK